MSETNAANTETAVQPVKEAPAAFRVILGTKEGMTQLFDAAGHLRAVTVIKAGPCRIINIRTPERDGYSAVCLGFGEVDKEDLNKPRRGFFDKINLAPARHLKEFRVAAAKDFEAGQSVTLKDRFQPGDYVDVQGKTKGRGFAGAMKRHGFHGLPASHGASDKERSPGSLASQRSLGRVIPGQRMAGHMGQETFTMAKIEVVKVDADKNLLFVDGSVPGASGSLVTVLETSKTRKKRLIQAPKASAKKAKKEAPKAAAKAAPAAKK